MSREKDLRDTLGALKWLMNDYKNQLKNLNVETPNEAEKSLLGTMSESIEALEES